MRAFTRALTTLALLPTLLIPVGVANADPANTGRTENFFFQFNDCNDEFIQLEGTRQFVSKLQKDGTALVNINIKATGTGLQGNEYLLNWNYSARASLEDFRLQERIRLISKGSAPNQVLITRYDPDTGLFTFEAECRG